MTSVITLFCFIQVVLLPAIANIFAYPVSKPLCMCISNYIVRVCAHRIFTILSAYKQFRFIGDEESKKMLPEHFLIISNHQSLIDIPLYMNYFRDKELRFVAKAELGRHVPLVSEMLRVQEHCMIPRKGSPSIAMKTLDSFGKRAVERGQIPVLFPEGTRSKDGELGTFYAAGFRRLTDAAHLPVAVCALDGGWRINNLKNIMINLYRGSYRVKVLKVYPAPQNKEEQVAILDEAKQLISDQLKAWRSL
ncbi:MAG: 1-acyl-sn-glycerol-3-phosphate acyltransferase [Treponema sp.]|nr:1-acyl-sn-glycerol-3-phosphate acyltransferase [Treponema sp.]